MFRQVHGRAANHRAQPFGFGRQFGHESIRRGGLENESPNIPEYDRETTKRQGALYREAVALRSPGSRSAPWEGHARVPIYPEGVGQGLSALCNPFGVGLRGGVLPQGALRNPGLRNTTASR